MAKPLKPSAVLARRVRELREQHGWTLDELRERLSAAGWTAKSRTSVGDIETMKVNVTPDKLLRLAYVLDTSPIHLLIPPRNSHEPGEVRVAITDDVAVGPLAARMWWRGELTMPGQDVTLFGINAREVREGQWAQRFRSEVEMLERKIMELRTAVAEEDVARAANVLRYIAQTAEHLHDRMSPQTLAELAAWANADDEGGDA